MKTFYVTTPIYYPNANLHMGHAYTTTVCDILARAHKLQGEEVYFLTGSDENTGKIVKVSADQSKSVAVYLDETTEKFKELYSKLNISYDQFIRTSDQKRHWPGAIALWNKLVESSDIYQSTYSGLYCVGCESFYTEKDLVDGKCPIHLTVPERIEEKNHFFRLSKYTSVIKEKIESDKLKIVPQSRKNEILAFLDNGLEDISFSRPKKNVPHGIPVPGDPDSVIYVWGDALVNYISALGYGQADNELFEKFWPANAHVIGKDILRFHAAIWPGMLLSAGLELPKSILVHGLILSGGVKMSKSLGNVVDPLKLIDEYGADAVRYYLAREISLFEDGELTPERFKEAYNANLANGLGNLVSRVMKMAEDNLEEPVKIPEWEDMSEYFSLLDKFEIGKAADLVWKKISELDLSIQTNQPFKMVKSEPEKGKQMISELVVGLYTIARMLNPILPETSAKIKFLIKQNKMPESPLFVRKD